MSLRTLARASGVSASMISDVERGAKSPTIAVLSAIAEALGVPISALLEEPETARAIRVVRPADRLALVDPDGARRETLSPPAGGSRVEFLRYVLPPGTDTGDFAPHARGAIERVYLERGAVRARFGDATVGLAAGDTCLAFADRAHGFRNDGAEEAVIFLIIERP